MVASTKGCFFLLVSATKVLGIYSVIRTWLGLLYSQGYGVCVNGACMVWDFSSVVDE